MNLRGGQPLWTTLTPARVCASEVDHNLTCDVLVVGSGVTGALAASHLAEEGLDVVVVDRHGAARGSTPASTALLMYDLDTSLTELRATQGEPRANAVYRTSRRAVDDVQELVDRLHLDCDLVERPSLQLATSESEVSELRREASARRSIGLEAEYLDASTLRREFRMNRPGAILCEKAMALDPWRFTNELLEYAEECGCRIFSNTRVSPVMEWNSRPRCVTANQHCIEADMIIWATGYETPEEFPAVRRMANLKSTFVVATKPLPEYRLWPAEALVWDTGDPYTYARTDWDGRVIIGGGDEPFTEPNLRDRMIHSKACQLLHTFKQMYDLGNVEMETAWAGVFAETDDGLPYVGTMEEYPGSHFALGYGGNGITLSLIAAEILRDCALGFKNADAPLFSFTRREGPAEDYHPGEAIERLGAVHQ